MLMSNRALPVIRVSPARASRARLRLPGSPAPPAVISPRAVVFRVETGRIPRRDRFVPAESVRGEYPCHRGLSTRIRRRTISARVRQNDIGIGRRRAPPHDPQNSNAHPTAAPARYGQCHSDGHPGRQSGRRQSGQGQARAGRTTAPGRPSCPGAPRARWVRRRSRRPARSLPQARPALRADRRGSARLRGSPRRSCHQQDW